MLRNSIFSLITTVVRLATGVLLFIVLAKVWGPERFGVFMYPFTITTILIKFVDYGFMLQVARDIGRYPERAREIMGHTFGAKLLLLAPAALATLVVAVNLPQDARYGVLLGVLLCDTVANSFALFLNIPLRAFGHFDMEARIITVTNALIFAVVVGVVIIGYGPIPAAVALATGRTIYLAMSWYAYKRILHAPPRPILAPRSIGLVLRAGLPFGIHATVGTLMLHVDTLMVQHYLGAEPVGIYQAGMRILLGTLILGDALNSVYLSSMARSAGHAKEVHRLGVRMTRQLLTAGVVIFACTLGGGEWAVRLVFGDGYDRLISLLPLFGLLAFIRYGGISYGTLLTLADRQIVRVVAVCGVLVLGVVLNTLLIPRLGLTGAVAASIVSHIVLYTVYVLAARKDHGSFLVDWRSCTLLLIACATVLLSLLGPPSSPWTRLQLVAVIVLASVLVGVTRSEWSVLSSRITRVAA